MKKQTRSTPSPQYDVGYGKPPKATQFRKGQSGNPRGRNKADENLVTVFKRMASRLVKVNINGVTRMVSMAEAVIRQNMKAALGQDQVAMGNILRLAEASGEFLDWTNPELAGKPLFMPEKMSTEEFEAFYGVDTVHVRSGQEDSS